VKKKPPLNDVPYSHILFCLFVFFNPPLYKPDPFISIYFLSLVIPPFPRMCNPNALQHYTRFGRWRLDDRAMLGVDDDLALRRNRPRACHGIVHSWATGWRRGWYVKLTYNEYPTIKCYLMYTYIYMYIYIYTYKFISGCKLYNYIQTWRVNIGSYSSRREL